MWGERAVIPKAESASQIFQPGFELIQPRHSLRPPGTHRSPCFPGALTEIPHLQATGPDSGSPDPPRAARLHSPGTRKQNGYAAVNSGPDPPKAQNNEDEQCSSTSRKTRNRWSPKSEVQRTPAEDEWTLETENHGPWMTGYQTEASGWRAVVRLLRWDPLQSREVAVLCAFTCDSLDGFAHQGQDWVESVLLCPTSVDSTPDKGSKTP